MTTPSPVRNVGASSAAVTVRVALSLAALNAVAPPVAEMATYCPSLPVLRSQARKVIASFSVPFRSPKGSRRRRAAGPSSRASSLVEALIAAASIVSQLEPPSRLNCQVPRPVPSAVIAIASAGGPSGSARLPSTSSEATVVPPGFAAPSGTLPSAGVALGSSSGASFTAVTVIVAMSVAAL